MGEAKAGCRACREEAPDFALAMAFQPIVDIETNGIYAYEALVRGADGASAATVIARVTPETLYAFDQQCRVAAIRQAVEAGILLGDARLSINFLPNAVYSPLACIQLTLRTARETGFPTDRLIFEFTENEELDAAHVQGIVDSYRQMGFATALDDFGAGHAGLGLLARFTPDALKLDRELIQGIDESLPRRLIVDCVARLAERLGIRVVAEGVETPGEMMTLQALGIRYQQGYLFARPEIGRLPVVPPLERLRKAA